MQPIRSILDETILIRETTDDPNMAAMANLVEQLALRLMEAEALAATNEMQLQRMNSTTRVA